MPDNKHDNPDVTNCLCHLAVNQKARIKKVTGGRALKKRLLEMGFVKGEEIALHEIAPLGDPLDFKIKGYHISLRKKEAENVIIEIVDNGRQVVN